MTEQQIEPCLICDGKMKHTQPDEANHWFCSNYNVCGYDLIDDETSIEDHNERYGIIRLGKQAPTLLRRNAELTGALREAINWLKNYEDTSHQELSLVTKLLRIIDEHKQPGITPE